MDEYHISQAGKGSKKIEKKISKGEIAKYVIWNVHVFPEMLKSTKAHPNRRLRSDIGGNQVQGTSGVD